MTEQDKTLLEWPLRFVRSPAERGPRNPLMTEWNRTLSDIARNRSSEATTVKLDELIDFSLLNAIFQDFFEVVGLPQSILDLEGRVLASSNWQRICMTFHRTTPRILERCIESDMHLAREIQEGKPYAIRRCPNGLTDCAAPIVIEGQHIANLAIGQFLLAQPDAIFFEAQRAEFGFDKEAYEAALAEVPIISEEKLPAILNLMTGLAQQIATQSLAEHRTKVAYRDVERQVQQRTAELNASMQLMQRITSQVPGMVFQYRQRPDGKSFFPFASKAATDIFRVDPIDIRENAGALLAATHPDDRDAILASIDQSALKLTSWNHEFRVRFDDDTVRWLLGNARPERDADGSTLWHGFITDITARKQAEADALRVIEQLTAANEKLKTLNEKLEQTRGQLQQSEKMAAVGQLAAGVAHEINNPIGFIKSNLGTLKSHVQDLLSVITAYENLESNSETAGRALLLDAVNKAKATADLEFLREDIQSLVAESLDGVDRVKKIVDNLKDFSRVDSGEWQLTNLENGLESTLNIVWNEIKYKAEVVREFAGLPEIECIASQLNQVFMNLLVNAAHAIEARGTITLRTGFDVDWVWIDIGDTGSGIKPEHLNRIFEPFFTTKPVGKGTGLGLSLAYGIIQQHKGKLDVQSQPGRGSTFRITLPRARSADDTDPQTARAGGASD